MTDLAHANFEDLLTSYFYKGASARLAADLALGVIAGECKIDLGRLLRHHEETPVSDSEEIHRRYLFDQLMEFCSVIEIAELGHFIPEPGDSRHQFGDFWADFAKILDQSNVRKYYETNYPLALTQSLHLRLQGRGIKTDIQGGKAAGPMLAFLAMDGGFRERIRSGYLLRLLDDFTIDGYRFSDLLDAMLNPMECRDRLLRPAKDRDVIDEALLELGNFFQFCDEFSRLLENTEPYPLLQSAFWHHFSYWFDALGTNYREKFQRATENMSAWAKFAVAEQDAKILENNVSDVRRSLDNLMSRRYADAMEQALYALD